MINLQEALERAGGDPELLTQIAKLFLEDSPAGIGRLEASLRRRDMTGAALEAHSIKGAAGHFGAQLVVEAAARLENDLRAGRCDVIGKNVFRLKLELSRLNSELKRLAEVPLEPSLL